MSERVRTSPNFPQSIQQGICSPGCPGCMAQHWNHCRKPFVSHVFLVHFEDRCAWQVPTPSGSIPKQVRKAKAQSTNVTLDNKRDGKSQESLQQKSSLPRRCLRMHHISSHSSVSEDDGRRKQMSGTKYLGQGACAIFQPASFYLI